MSVLAAMPAILDVEASGFGRGSYPIEVGFIEGEGRSFCALIHPLPDWKHWDDEAESLHGITRDLLLQHGKPPGWVAAEMNTRLHGQTVYCDGWGQDYPWLARLYDSADMQPSFRLEDLRRLLNEEEAARWHRITADVRREQNICRHRASTDAKVLQLALLRVKRNGHGT
ncbi:MAG TPA: hypothetical protein VGM81_04395 [Burkholderiaceae bacterium]|jgi:hypothetical protein